MTVRIVKRRVRVLAVSKDWIQTFSGVKFAPLAAHGGTGELRIEDIARALSMQCRFAGHVLRFYSVAEHCVRVAAEVERLYPEDKMLQRAGLIHDASEAYLVDVPSPLKHQPEFDAYRRCERELTRRINRWAQVDASDPRMMVVTMIDQAACFAEADVLKSPLHPEWEQYRPTALVLDWESRNLGWTPELAEAAFLSVWRMCQ